MKRLTPDEFVALCEQHCVLPEVALESEAVRQALQEGKSAEEISEILAEEF